LWSGVILPRPFAAIAADEIANYTSDRFLAEPDLWRVQIRSLRALEKATRETEEGANAAAAAVKISLYGFLTGLAFSLISLGTLILEMI
jgi:hypothetical protein